MAPEHPSNPLGGYEDAAAARAKTRASFLNLPDPKPRQYFGLFLPKFTLSYEVLWIAMPVVLGMITQTLINVLDTAMVGRLHPETAQLGQAAIQLTLPLMWMLGGSLSALWVGTQALTSRRAGEGDDARAGAVLSNSLALALVGSLMLTTLGYVFAPWVVGLQRADPALVATATEYLRIRLLGMFAMVGTFSFKSFFDGIGRTAVFMSAAVVMNLLNVVLNVLFIFGEPRLGIPRLEVAGAALASVCSAYVGLFILALVAAHPFFYRRYRTMHPQNLSTKIIWDILRLSLPNAVATIVVMLGFVAFYWVVGEVNARHCEVGKPVIEAANAAVVTVLMLVIMSALAVGSATAAMTSQALGAGRPRLAASFTWEAVRLWFWGASLCGVVMALAPEQLVALINPDPEVIAEAVPTLRMIAFMPPAVSATLIVAQTLHGVGLADYVMRIELFCHLVLMAPVAYFGGIVMDWGLRGVYLAPITYILVLGAAVFGSSCGAIGRMSSSRAFLQPAGLDPKASPALSRRDYRAGRLPQNSPRAHRRLQLGQPDAGCCRRRLLGRCPAASAP